jgi:hypothetical protein
VSYCEIAYETKWIEDTNRCSSTFGNNPSSQEESQHVCGLFENLFTYQGMCDENYERRVEAGVQALVVSVEDTPLEEVRFLNIYTSIFYSFVLHPIACIIK